MKLRFVLNDPKMLVDHRIGFAGFDLDTVLSTASLGGVRKILKKFGRTDGRGLLNHLPSRNVYRDLLQPVDHIEASVSAILQSLGMYAASFKAAAESFEFQPVVEERELTIKDMYSLKLYFDLVGLSGNMGKHNFVKKGNFYERSIIENGYVIFWEDWVTSHNTNRFVIDSIMEELLKIKFAQYAGFTMPDELLQITKPYHDLAQKLNLDQADTSYLILDKIDTKSWKNGEFVEKDLLYETYVEFDYALLKKYKDGKMFERISDTVNVLNSVINGGHGAVSYINKSEAVMFAGMINKKQGINFNDLHQTYLNRRLYVNFPIEAESKKTIEYNPAIFTQLKEDSLIYGVDHLSIDNYVRIPMLIKDTAEKIMDMMISNNVTTEHKDIELSVILEKYKIMYIEHEKSLCLVDLKEIESTDIRTGWLNRPIPALDGAYKFYKKLGDNNIQKAIQNNIEIYSEEGFKSEIRKNRPTREVPQFTLTPMDDYYNDKSKFDRKHLLRILGISEVGRRLFYEKYKIEYSDFIIVSKMEEEGGPNNVTGVLGQQGYIDLYNTMINSDEYKNAAKFSFDDFMLIFYKIKTDRKVYTTFNDNFNNVYTRILNSAVSMLNKFRSKEFIESRSESGIVLSTIVEVDIAGYTFKIKNEEAVDFIQYQTRQLIDNLQVELCKCVMAEFGITPSTFRSYAIELAKIKLTQDDGLKSLFDLYNSEVDGGKTEISLVEAEKLLSDELDVDSLAANIAKQIPEEVKSELRRRTTQLMSTTKFKQFSDGLTSGMALMNNMIGGVSLDFGLQATVIQRLLNMNK